MKQLLLIVISLGILFIALLSIYINHYRFEVHFRVINLVQSRDLSEILYDEVTLPYMIDYGLSSEYITLPRGKRNIYLNIVDTDSEIISFDNITLSRDSLNTLILLSKDDEVILQQAATPKRLAVNKTALRYLDTSQDDKNVKVTIVNSDINYKISSKEEFLGKYKLLTEGSYVLIIDINGEESLSRVFLEAGEIYTLAILHWNESGLPSLRLYVDNPPGDQYITPRKYPTR